MKSLKLFLLIFSLLTIVTGKVVSAEDDIIIPESEDETFIPPAPNGESSNQPIIMDESDSADVSDVEEYDG